MKWKWGSGLRRGSAGVKPEPAELSWAGAAGALPAHCLHAASGCSGEMLAGWQGGEICFGLTERKASLPFCLYFFFFILSASFSRSCHFT